MGSAPLPPTTVAPKDLLYTKSHEWIKVEGNIGTIGITDVAARELGDIVFVDLPGALRFYVYLRPIFVVKDVQKYSMLIQNLTML